MRYADAIARLFALQSRGVRLGESRMRKALALRGHPERGQVFVHVGGTNGKGSVSAMIASCLSQAGYRTGLYTSPHLHRYVERICIDGKPIREAEAARRITELLEIFEGTGTGATTFFELTTLLALEAFRDHRCDVVVLEVGLGGRLDATNVVTPAVSVITRVALDHTQVLGDSIAAIAREKAGIIKRGVPLITAVRDAKARAVIERRARRMGAEVLRIDRDFSIRPGHVPQSFDVQVGEREISGLRIALQGEHQRENAACAIAALQRLHAVGFDVSELTIRRGLSRVRWPGRLECVRGRPQILLDAAHNLDGCRALVRYLENRPSAVKGRRVLVFGALADKDYRRMLRLLALRMDTVIFCMPAMPRAASFTQLARVTKGARSRNVTDALRQARHAAGASGEIIVAGSIFLLAEVRAELLGLRSDPLIRM